MSTLPVSRDATPWWRIGMVWLVVSGPLIVVIAAVATAVIAIRGADLVITEVPSSVPQSGEVQADTPAMAARNHAATAAP
ncbi:hypothetical protein [Rubrivivax gelatinosus]|nr:hypothetical protein [Rubrivivax gelatinosus]MBG6078428.1 hypothetical protein [Rubrivivax gelatinosus]